MVQKSGVHQLRLVVYPISYRDFFYIPGGAGFLPSTVTVEAGIFIFTFLESKADDIEKLFLVSRCLLSRESEWHSWH